VVPRSWRGQWPLLGTVQAIKSPTLLEFSGPLFMSQPVANNVQYRLSEEKRCNVIKFRHLGFGLDPGRTQEGCDRRLGTHA